MIKAESYKARLDSEEGLNFIEFNYMILQAYDFLVLFDEYNCGLQMGGSDQWGNIVAGIDLIRRLRKSEAYGAVFPLIMTSSGIKMGKTHKGAIWLDPQRTSPYEYYQYWVNTDDQDVIRFLSLFTFIPIQEINLVRNLTGEHLNALKNVLAFEATRIAHGREEALKAHKSAIDMFGARRIPEIILPSSSIPRSQEEADLSMPTTYLDLVVLDEGLPIFKLFQKVGLSDSGSSAKRLIAQGGAYLNEIRMDTDSYLITTKDFVGSELILRAGKKRYHRIKLK
jgi:tyrosyl-tRNA synthetase